METGFDISVRKVLHTSTGETELALDYHLEPGTLLTLYGPSGAGKTTFLRILAGFVRPEQGYIRVDGRTWLDTEKGVFLPPRERGIGLVFQDYALFPNMTVRQNLRYALPKGQSEGIISELMKIMELEMLADRKPQTLSGGQQQRVALARALVRRPRLLLLDEPLSALDRDLRSKLQNLILELHGRFRLTTFLVSHDVSEIYRMSDQVLVLKDGKVIQKGSPTQVFSRTLVSGKFQFLGEVLRIDREDVFFIVSVLVGKNLVKVTATDKEVAGLQEGDRVIVASKAFNPLLIRI